MFEGSAAQFLCILESLADTSKRTLLTAPPAQDSEPEILDVYAELIMAGQEILAGKLSPRQFIYAFCKCFLYVCVKIMFN